MSISQIRSKFQPGPIHASPSRRWNLTRLVRQTPEGGLLRRILLSLRSPRAAARSRAASGNRKFFHDMTSYTLSAHKDEATDPPSPTPWRRDAWMEREVGAWVRARGQVAGVVRRRSGQGGRASSSMRAYAEPSKCVAVVGQQVRGHFTLPEPSDVDPPASCWTLMAPYTVSWQHTFGDAAVGRARVVRDSRAPCSVGYARHACCSDCRHDERQKR